MYRVYMGNLDTRVSTETLHALFEEHGLSATNILVKRGYAFADCPDQNTVDKTIDKLHGYNLMGATMQVEPSNRRRRSNRIYIRNVSPLATKEDIEHLVRSFGSVQRCELIQNEEDCSVQVTYETADEAAHAVEQLNGYTFQEAPLRVGFGRSNNGSPRMTRNGSGGALGGPRNTGNGNSRGSGYPLRILVPSDFVGAIIGKGGETIRGITKRSNSRVDVHGKENSGLLEKVISIYGSPENCTLACKEILTVMQNELESPSRPVNVTEILLKMLADNRYCGRVIGREGRVIKKIREDTQTTITVSNLQEVASMFPDRVISVRGPIANISQAEASISNILRECYEKEMQQPQMDPRMMAMQGAMGGIPVVQGGLFPGGGHNYYGAAAGMYSSPNLSGQQHQSHQGMGDGIVGPHCGTMQPPVETVQICVPNSSVGALIGAGGSNIRQIIRDSNAYVTIEPKKDDDLNPATERIVTIKGTVDSLWRGSYYVFEKLKSEGFSGSDDMRLRTAIKVPQKAVGFVIGKGGKHVREVQRMTGAMIKLPEEQANQGEEVVVEAYGTFMSVHSAHNRVRALAEKHRMQQMRGGNASGGQASGGGNAGSGQQGNPPINRRSGPPPPQPPLK